MNREDKIKAIYKEMANKKLSFGCYVKTDNGELVVIEVEEYWIRSWIKESNWFVFKFGREDESKYEIIWHPVMIGNVIEYLRIVCEVFIEWQAVEDSTVLWRWRDYKTLLNGLIFNWYRADLPIEKQTDECVEYVYNLIRN